MTKSAPALAALPAEDLVAALHPYGEWSSQHSASAAHQIAELVRYLNHATIDHTLSRRYRTRTPRRTLIGALHTTCKRLPQLLDQLAGRMRTLAADPDLATGSSADGPQVLAERSAAFLAAARPALSELAVALGKAHQAADRLYLDVDDDE